MMNPVDLPGFMRDHRFARARMSEYIEGELTRAQTDRIDKHTRVCPFCRRLLADLRRMIVALGHLRSQTAGELADEVIARLRAGP